MADNANHAQRPSGRKLAQAAQSGRTSTSRASSSRSAGSLRSRALGVTGSRAASSSHRHSSSALSRAGRGSRRAAGGSGARPPRYPRPGKGPIARWLPSWRVVLGTFLFLVAAVIGTFVVAYQAIDVPEPSQFAQAQTTTVYYADGSTVMGTFAEIDRTVIDTSALPDYVGNAVVSSEDRSFYSNNGVDPKGIVRAFWNNLRGGSTQGASTLTQQYIKNYYVDTTSSYVGKFKQAIMAIKIDREMSKEEILDSYLNTVYFGRGAYGIQAASQAFFGKDAADLTVSESALLAGILPAPSAWDPAVDATQAQARWQRVMDYMLADDYITQDDYDSAAFPQTVDTQTQETYAGTNGYLLQLVRSELESDAGLTAEQIDTGGYSIVTTIDKTDQDAAVASVQSLPAGASPDLRTALVSVDVSTGGILALYGGSDYLTDQVNSATDAVAQAGSTFKPFALVAALENGDTLANGYSGNSPMTIEGTSFQNYQNVSYGWSNLVKATTYSINTVYLQLNEDLGPSVTNAVAVRAGYPQDTAGLDEYTQNVLGSASPHTVDIATAYATFASQGTRHDTHIVGSVLTAQGDAAYTATTDGEKVFDDGVMADATYAMQQVVNSGSGRTALALDRPVAAKTGSSSDNKSAQFAGYTPQIATAVTMYQTGADGSEESITPWGRYSEITGSTYPAAIFTQYMQTALANLPVEEFPDRTTGSYTAGSLDGTTAATQSSVVQAPAPAVTAAPTAEAPVEAPVTPEAVTPTVEATPVEPDPATEAPIAPVEQPAEAPPQGGDGAETQVPTAAAPIGGQ